MEIIILDTNVYGWYIEYSINGGRQAEAVDAFNLLSKVLEMKNKVEVLATQTIEREIKNAKNSALSQLFYSTIKGVIKTTKRMNELAEEYYNECKKAKLHFVTIDDCEIVASATITGIKFLVTENRKTLNNPKVIEIIETVNSSRGLRRMLFTHFPKISSRVFPAKQHFRTFGALNYSSHKLKLYTYLFIAFLLALSGYSLSLGKTVQLNLAFSIGANDDNLTVGTEFVSAQDFVELEVKNIQGA